MMQKETLLGLILDSLSLFGDNTKAALLIRMQNEGVVFTPDEFDIDKFCRVIQDLLGNHAEFVIVKIVDDFCKYSKSIADELELTRIVQFGSHAEVIKSLFRIAEM
jgi:hypothetical protein